MPKITSCDHLPFLCGFPFSLFSPCYLLLSRNAININSHGAKLKKPLQTNDVNPYVGQPKS